MYRNRDGMRRRWTALFFVLAALAVAALIVGYSAAAGRPVSAQILALTPRAFLPIISAGGAPGSNTPTPTLTPTATATATATTSPTAAPDTYDQVHLAWVDAPSTTLTVVWRTLDTSVPSAVQYREAGAAGWQTATGAPRPSGTAGTLHEVTVSGLKPGTLYEYRVQAPGGWSATFSASTAPAPGPASFDAVFFADTGLVGRTDGLATGTQQVIDEIAKMKPLVLLGGGDYAYFDTDKRYGTYEKAIDEWFNQMQPVAARAPLMLTYGNHEYELDSPPVGTAPWAGRLPMMPGDDSRRYYSFDVGDVHFMGLFAATDKAGMDAGQLGWIEQDANAAKARGMRWIVPYFHVVVFGDGTNHKPNLMLRSQVGPLFERLGVKIALYAHDQAYERSYPLTDVPNSNTPTSTSLTCYTQQDGVVYVKVSPGGKQSNISGAFAPFASATKPAWTAVRDNTLHHLVRLRVSPASITVEGWGVKGDGSAPVLLDSFKVTTGQCP